MNHVEPIEEVFAEAALTHLGREIAIRRCDHTHVDGNRIVASHALEVPLLEHPQELGLHERGEFPDLVEEERAAVRLLEPADAAFVGAGEGALLVPEHFALEERFGDGRAMERNERRLHPWAQRVDRSRKLALACATLARDEHCRARRGHSTRDAVDFLHRGARTDEALQTFSVALS